MKLNKLKLGALLFVLSGVTFGASIDHIQNYTPEYNANPAQQGAINAGTSAYYNPAGLMHIENGSYFQIGAQAAIGVEEMKYEGETYDADLMDIVPNISFINKNDNRAYYWTMGGLAGGGSLEYSNGAAGIAIIEDIFRNGGSIGDVNLPPIFKNAKITENYAEGSNAYIQSTLGRAWFITDKVSVSAAGRVVYGSRELKGKLGGDLTPNIPGSPLNGIEADIDSERTAWGYGGVFGLNYAATDRLNLGMRYDTRVIMNFEADASENKASVLGANIGFSDIFGQYADGVKSRRDLPAILAMGASYKMSDRWSTFVGGNYYFNEDAKLDDDYTDGNYDNGWEVSLGSEYWLNSKVAWMLGANYAVTGADEETYSDVEYALDSIMLGTGLKYRQDETTEWVVSVSHYWYDTTTGKHYEEGGSIENPRYGKEITAVGVSLTKKFN